MTNILRIAEHLAISIWIGSILFIAFAVAPALSQALAPAFNGPAFRAILTRYYLIAGICGTTLVAVAVARGIKWGWTGMQPMALMLFIATGAITLVAWWLDSARPAMNLSLNAPLLLNVLVLLLLFAYVAWMGMRGY